MIAPARASEHTCAAPDRLHNGHGGRGESLPGSPGRHPPHITAQDV